MATTTSDLLTPGIVASLRSIWREFYEDDLFAKRRADPCGLAATDEWLEEFDGGRQDT